MITNALLTEPEDYLNQEKLSGGEIMKLVSFKTGKSAEVQFGLMYGEKVYPFRTLAARYRVKSALIDNIYSYLENLPASFNTANEIHNRLLNEKKLSAIKGFSPEKIIILPPVPEPAALLDFGLSPRHLINSSKTLFRYEIPFPLNLIAAGIAGRRLKKTDKNALLYYKGNHNEMIGHGDTTHWPAYTSYLDIEPELAFVTGRSAEDKKNSGITVAGYTILNDFSARDVQLPEMIGLGLARSKDFSRSNGLGPYLVTPDEAGNPLNIDVSVSIGDRYKWGGTTSEYSASPDDIIRYCGGIFDLRPGTVIGMGTIPGCCGLDNDLWVCPGDRIDITFDKLGTLTQYIPAETGTLSKSRWTTRGELGSFYR